MIRVLEKNISDKIAAGEVIERPYSVIKELVENAVDSGADSIICEIKNGGKTYIRVTDNGCGIEPDECEVAFLRHATSKIDTVYDLDAIETLGFRGEALASIAAVSQTEMITKVRSCKTGVRLVYKGGRVLLREDIGCPDGTTVVVTDLFYNTPARAKFLKTDSAEAGLIIDYISKMALCYKDIKFRLINNDKILFSTAGDGNRFKTILRVYPNLDDKHMVPVNYEENGMSLEGYISTPALSRSSRISQIFFVNGRHVDSRVMEKGVSFGYRERLFEGRYPVCFLFLSIDPASLDVNIHPNKMEVRFDNDGAVAEFIGKAIQSTLSSKEAIVDAAPTVFEKMEKLDGIPSFMRDDNRSSNLFKTEVKPKTDSEQRNIRDLLKSMENRTENVQVDPGIDFKFDKSILDMPEVEISTKNYEEKKAQEAKAQEVKRIEIYEPILRPFDFNELWVTGCIFDTYITATDSDNFYIIDQHAAQERVFYEKLVGSYEAGEKVRQTILTPLMLNVDYSQLDNSNEWINTLTEMGFTIEEFGGNTFRITEIPMFMEIGEADAFLKEFIANLKDNTTMRNTVVINKLITMSCKAAIKAHDKLSLNEMKALLKDLAECRNPFSCPHGRPTAIKLSNYDIEKLFKRVQ